jgi:HK97 family phage prohead protease
MHVGLENKSFPTIFKEINERTVTGITAVFGNIDDGWDIIHPGAFKKTLKENVKRVRHLWQHDGSRPPIATIKAMREVGVDEIPKEIRKRFPEVSGGLMVERTYLETDRGNEVLTAIKAGALDEMSIGYSPVKFDFEEVGEDDPSAMMVRNLREVRLWDTSDVNWGMNPATAGVKSVIPFRAIGTAEKDSEWVIPDLDLVNPDHFAYFKDGEGSFIHHDAEGLSVFSAVALAMDLLVSAEVDLDPAERVGVYNHLVKHFVEYGERAPIFATVELGYLLKEAERIAVKESAEIADQITSIRSDLRAEPTPSLTRNYRNRLDLLKTNLEFMEVLP